MSEFHPLSRGTVRQLAALEVREDQANLVASNLLTMAQSIFEPGSEIFGIWDNDEPVGLLAIVDMSHPEAELDEGDDPDGIYIWRLMVDRNYQRRGHGLAALDFSRELAHRKKRSKLVVGVVDEPGCALPLYEAFGFKRTGRILQNEVELILHLGRVQVSV
ncbi:GNAT family N-acetyltransferase [Aliiroseovarius sp. KMU-50]|uniref:GNAT family N-acetyltransferase n=1 Tax=Aliiroseovarius salicola TaxID=3009082 RepID=A0ABT4VW73_9RHOB|nr:GNAT family N-acetyltransferase [Aliiroseovarius sp. KMU-50]MDA5092499.1 GNAT family N-acetyltransferase [Aliiroseovarius sp. KMU-50]